MEIRINVVLIALLAAVWLGLRAHSPAAVVAEAQAPSLATLEDTFAHDRMNQIALSSLTEAYLEASQAELAIVVLRAAEPALLEEPGIAHQLARAYEQTGRLHDALATADLALTRCARVLGARPLDTAVPHFGCSENIYSKLDIHRLALERMVQWGIVDPRVDPRATRAYDEANRKRRMVINSLGTRQTSVE